MLQIAFIDAVMHMHDYALSCCAGPTELISSMKILIPDDVYLEFTSVRASSR